MEYVATVLLLLVVVAATGVLNSFVKLPVPLVQIGVGAVLAWPLAGLHVSLDPEVFFLLFIPPLLFADGWRMPKREFWELRWPIATMALGLVLFTVAGVGEFIHWLIPGIPLPVAFALAAVLSPTDAVAVSALTGRMPMPRRLMHVLEGEALMNDASGLVAFKFALAAALTGVFSLRDAALSFVVIASGGLFTGWLLTWLLSRFRRRIINIAAEEPATEILLMLLLPFAAYIAAERFGFSGILAAVAAGMTLNFGDIMSSSTLMRVQSRGVWAMLESVFNGSIFLLLGMQLPDIVRAVARPDGHLASAWRLAALGGYVLAISLALIVLRFVWVWVAWRVMIGVDKLKGVQASLSRPSLRFCALTALSGVRGAVTLAGALSVPLTMAGGAPFAGRDLLIFLAAGVILLSLIGGSVALPLLLRGMRMPPGDPRRQEVREARASAAEAAIRAIEETHKKIVRPDDESDAALCADAAARVMERYRRRIDAEHGADDIRDQARRATEVEQQLRRAALQAERVELYRLRVMHRINDETLREILSDIDFAEISMGGVLK